MKYAQLPGCGLLAFIHRRHVQGDQFFFGRELLFYAMSQRVHLDHPGPGGKSRQCYNVGGTNIAQTDGNFIDRNAKLVGQAQKTADFLHGAEADGGRRGPGGVLGLIAGVLVERGRRLVRPGGQARLSFGIDHRILVSFALEPEDRRTGGLINKKRRVERWSQARVMNSHRLPVEVTVLDQMPVSQDELIKVELIDGSTAPTERDFDDEPGVLAWRRTLEPKEELVVRFGYAVIFPGDRPVQGF